MKIVGKMEELVVVHHQLKTKYGWLHIYHAATKDSVYHLGAFLTDLEDPTIITYKTKEPILSPDAIYEKEGFFGNVVFYMWRFVGK